MSSSEILAQLLTVCHSWVTLIFAVAGGFVARYVASRNTRAAASPDN
jgi:hypothetical protein